MIQAMLVVVVVVVAGNYSDVDADKVKGTVEVVAVVEAMEAVA